MELGLSKQQWEEIINDVVRIFVKAEMHRHDITATGKLEKSMVPENRLLYAVYYVEYADRGRGPGGLPPIDKLIRWVNVKLGVTDEKEASSIAWGIAKKMEAEGSQRHRDGGYSAFLYVLETERVLQYIQDHAFSILGRQVESDVYNFIDTKTR